MNKHALDGLGPAEEAELNNAGSEDNSFNSFNSSGNTHKTLSQWPEPPDEEAFYGLPGDIVRTIEPHSEADPVSLLIQTLIAAGNDVGRGPHFQVESDIHTLNMYAVIVGNTSKGRKGTSWGRIRRIFEQIDPEWVRGRIQDGLSSGEGLISAVRDPTERSEPIRQGKNGQIVRYQNVIDDEGVADKRLLVMQGEFASALRVLERVGNTLSPVIRQAWETGNLQTMTKTPMSATDAHISIIGHITVDELRRYLTLTEAGYGFANRFLYHCVRRSKLLPEGGHLVDSDLIKLRRRLKEAIEFASTIKEMRRNDESRTLWRNVYQELSEPKPGLFGAITSRAEAQVTRLSCIYALLDKSPEIRLPHLLAALALWEHAEASAKFIFGDALGDPVADEILKALRSNPGGLTRTDISKLFNKNKDASEIGRALNLLAQQGLARYAEESTDGRSAERWFSI